MTVKEALEWGEKHAKDADLGEHPAGSNHTPVWQDYHRITGAPAFQGQPWCGAMVIDVVEHSHEWHAPSNWIGVFAIQAWGEQHDRFHRGTTGLHAGDALIIGGPGKHTGIARGGPRPDGTVPTIEGNTSPGSEGSQFNGGTVALKTRSRGEIFGYVSIHDLLDGGHAPAPEAAGVKRVAQPQYRPEGPTGPVRIWEHGPRVHSVQQHLGVPADGYFGPQTKQAAAAAKLPRGVEQGGAVLHPEAIEQLAARPIPAPAFHTLRRGSKGAAVRILQQLLNAHGARLEADGDFGPKTEAAVNKVKTHHGLPSDGVAGPRLWQVLTSSA